MLLRKGIILILFVFSFKSAINAQVEVTPVVGVSFGKVRYGDKTNGRYTNLDNFFETGSATYGVDIELIDNKKFGLLTIGFLYSETKSSALKYFDFIGDLETELTFNSSYINIQYSRPVSRVGTYLFIGPSIEFASNIRLTTKNVVNSTGLVKNISRYGSFIGVGYAHKRLKIKGTYIYGLGNISKSNSNLLFNTSRLLMIQLGYDLYVK